MPRSIISADLNLKGVGAALSALSSACREIDVPFFLVGALARDLLLYHLRGIERSPRLTQDVDVAVAVADWAHFKTLTTLLTGRHGFLQTRTTHRLKTPEGLLIDVVPFGGIEDGSGRIRWPPEFDVEMSVIGYREALGFTEQIRLDDLIVEVLGLLTLGPLKLLAWNERRYLTPRDAEDLCFVLSTYYDAEPNRMIDLHADLFDIEDGDGVFIGARAYGRDVAPFVSSSTLLKQQVFSILQCETFDLDESRLATALVMDCVYALERRFEILRRFRTGLFEAS